MVSELPQLHSEKVDGFNQLETGTVEIYGSMFERISWDLKQADHILHAKNLNYADLIHAAAHLRLTIESTVYASFVANHAKLAEVNKVMSSTKTMAQAQKILKDLNPDYWPYGVEDSFENGERLVVPVKNGLREEEIGEYYGKLSEVLHARNPARKKPRNPEQYLETYKELSFKLVRTLANHMTHLADSSERLYARIFENPVKIQGIKVEPIKTQDEADV